LKKAEVKMSMDTSVFVAVITASGSILAGALTFYLTKRHQWKVEWQHQKLNHYKVLLSSLSDLAVDGTDKEEANQRFALAVNTTAIVAPQYVITALIDFHDEVKRSNPNKSPERHDELLKKLLLAIRKDIGLSRKEEKDKFVFHLIGSAHR
jgi:hypothetical protein